MLRTAPALIAAALVLCVVTTSNAQPEAPLPPIAIRAPLMAQVPTIDGTIGEAEWAHAFRGVGMVGYETRLAVARAVTWWIGTDGRMIFAAVRSELPPQGELLARIEPGGRDPFGTHLDDSVELWLAPNWSEDAKTPSVQFSGNPLGAYSDTKFDPRDAVAGQPWDGDWQFANSYHDGWWDAEIAIPIADLGVEDALESFRFRLTRNWKQPWEFSSTETAPGGFAQVASMSRFGIDPDAPRVQMLGFDRWLEGEWRLLLAVAHPGAAPEQVRVKMHAEAPITGMAAQVGQKLLSLEPGAAEEVLFERSLTARDIWTGSVQVTSEDEQTVWFSRRWRFRTEPPEELWSTVEREKKAIVLYFGYSPYQSRMQAKVDFSGVRQPDAVRQVQVSVWSAEGAEALAQVTVAEFAGHVAEAVFDVPELPAGDYEVRCTVVGDEVLKDAAIGEFFREPYEWEHNTLGMSGEVVEPFTPLTVNDGTVSAVLRDHEMSDLGLWRQVTAEGTPLLNGPMELRATVGGESVALTGGGTRFGETGPSLVAAAADLSGSGIEAQVRSVFDYDGLMTVTLELAGGDVTVDALDLVIPLRAEEAWLMHALGSGFGKNYAGAIPDGEGEVWNNTRAVTYGVPGRFVPYVWIGGPRRGVCWYADSDEGWAVGEDERSVSIVREGDTVSLVLHLIGRPVRLAEQPRTITFGLQATPVKPRPADWRSWTFDRGVTRPWLTFVQVFGCCPYWGCVTTSGDLYPRDRDFSFVERLVEINRRGEVADDDRRFLEEWNAGYRQEKYLDLYTRSTRYGYLIAVGPDVMVPYTAIRAARENLPEFLQFQDEWGLDTWSSRQWRDDDNTFVRIEPVRSHQDYAMWYYKRLMDLGFAGGIYWDVGFAMPSYNLLAPGAAYRAEDGTIHPGMGITSVRELMKRATTMYRESGRLPYHVDHMSNNAIVPKLAFSTIQLDWELNYGTDDFQDRFSPEYILTTTTGEQAGTVPTVLTGIRGAESSEQKTWLTRTLLGTTLVHEAKCWVTSDVDRDLVNTVMALCFDFGYGMDDCDVYRYWEDPPFSANRDDLLCILYRRGDALLLIATDYGEGGPCRVTLDAARLGLEGATLRAANAETDEPLAMVDGALTFDLAKHAFIMARVDIER